MPDVPKYVLQGSFDVASNPEDYSATRDAIAPQAGQLWVSSIKPPSDGSRFAVALFSVE